MSRRVAIVEDEVEIAARVEYNLARNGLQPNIFPGRRSTFVELLLVAGAGRAFSRDQLLKKVWGQQRLVTPRTVDVHVRGLRERMEEQPEQPRLLTTLRGAGYRLEKQETQ